MSDFIKVYRNVLEDEFCDELVNLFEQSEHKLEGTTGGGIDKTKKESIDLPLFSHPQYNEQLLKIMPILQSKFTEYIKEYHFMITSMFNLTLYHPETLQTTKLTEDNFNEVALPQLAILMQQLFYTLPPQLQKYEKNKGHYSSWHSETYPELPNNNSLHRVLLYVLYLNDVEEGGETEFYYQNVKARPKKGSLLIAPCYFTHTHRGNMPISNDKYILTSWLQFKDAKSLYK